MAVDFMEISGVEQVEKEGKTALNNLLLLNNISDIDLLIQQVIDDINNKIILLKKNEQDFLSMFDCSSTDQFKNRVANYYHYNNLMAFTGSSLNSIIKEFKSIHEQDKIQYARTIENLINNIVLSGSVRMRQDLIDAYKSNEVTNAFKQEIINVVLSELSNYGTKGSGLTSTKFASIKTKSDTDASGALVIAASATTENFKKHLEAMQATARKHITNKTPAEVKKILHARALLKGSTSTRINGNQLTQTFSINWGEAINNITKDNTGKGSDINVSDKELHNTNRKIVEMIISKLNLSSDMSNFARNLIYNKMLNKDPRMFFVGESYTQLEGILGEINAVIAIVGLLGDKYRAKAMSWVGSQPITSKTFKGKQPSIDIVLKDIAGVPYGIQVKNTTQDLKDDFLHQISFAGGDLQTILTRLGIQDDSITNLFFSDEFNVPFKKYGTKFKEVDRGPHHTDDLFPKYVDLDISIDDITAKINTYFLMYASDFLYMGMDNSFKSKLAALDNQITEGAGGNYVYIVGSQVFFASEMLQQLQEELQELQELQRQSEQLSFQVKAYIEQLEDDIGSVNIVSVRNGRSSKDNISSHKIKLKSSWKFHR